MLLSTIQLLLLLIRSSYAANYTEENNVASSGDSLFPSWKDWDVVVPGNHLVELSIPFPSGIALSEHEVNNRIVRVGNLRHSMIAIRPDWASVFNTKQALLPVSTCKNIIKKVEDYVESHGWTHDRHQSYPTTG